MIPDELRIPEPCPADWNAMTPRDRARHCATCDLEVMDVTAYRAEDALSHLRGRTGTRTCVSYVVRADGSVRFADSPEVPVARLRRLRAGVVAAAMTVAACGPSGGLLEPRLAGAPPEPPPAQGSSAHDEVDPTPPSTDSEVPCDLEPEVRLAGAPLPAPPPPREPEHRMRGEVRAPDSKATP